MTCEPTVLEGTLRIVTTRPVPVEAWRVAEAAIATMFLPDQFELELRDAGREYENDRDHLLSELAHCRAEIVRLREQVCAASW